METLFQSLHPDSTLVVIVALQPIVDAYPLAALCRSLDAEERSRVASYRFDRDRALYAASHCAERVILSRYLHVLPEAVSFEHRGRFQRPLLTGGNGPVPNISLSHSDAVFALAISDAQSVGLDCEGVRPLEEAEEIARLLFRRWGEPFDGEISAESRRLTITRAWTAAEAALKSIGVGLAIAPENVALSFVDGMPVRAEIVTPAERQSLAISSMDLTWPAPSCVSVAAPTLADVRWVIGDITPMLEPVP
jgi:phosphopantetheinyl transferase